MSGKTVKIKVNKGGNTPASPTADNAPPVPSRPSTSSPPAASEPASPVADDDSVEQPSTSSPASTAATPAAAPATSPAAAAPAASPASKSVASEKSDDRDSEDKEPEAESTPEDASKAELEAAADSNANPEAEAEPQDAAVAAGTAAAATAAAAPAAVDAAAAARAEKERQKQAEQEAAQRAKQAELEAAQRAKQAELEAAQRAKEVLAGVTGDVTRVYLERSNTYLEQKAVALKQLSDWNEKILVFFAFQRAPYLQKLNSALTRVSNGERAIDEAKAYVKFMSSMHNSASKHLKGITFFDSQLQKEKTHAPVLPPVGDSDPSVLALSTLSSLAYTTHEKHSLIVDDLAKIGEALSTLSKVYGSKHKKEISRMQSAAKACEESSRDVDELFKKHQEVYSYYSTAIRGPVAAPNAPAAPATQPPEKIYQKLTSTSRKDMWASEHAYREKVLALTDQHKAFFAQCTALLEELHKAEQERALKLHAVLQEVSNLYVQYYAGMHSIAVGAHTQVQAAVHKAVENYQLQKETQQQQQAELAAQSVPERTKSADKPLVKPDPPGPFPVNANVIIAGRVQRKMGFIKKWKDLFMVLTKDHYLHCFALEDLDDSKEAAEIFGPGSGTLTTTTDPSKIRFLLKKGKTISSAAVFTADVYDCIAEEVTDEKDAKKAAERFMLKVQPSGFFSSNWKDVFQCDNEASKRLWMQVINDHTSVDRIAQQQLQKNKE